MSFMMKKSSKNNVITLQQIMDFIYFENFSDILLVEKSKFIENLQNIIIDILKLQYKNSKNDLDKELSLFEKEKYSLLNHYNNDISLLKMELTKYSQNSNEIKYLKKFRKHCINLNQTPLHRCSEDKYGKFIEVFEKKGRKFSSKNINEKSLFVICTECRKCFYINFIKIFCSCCKTEYYSSKLETSDKENLLPATWSEYHCKPIILNETMKCIKCENVLYINLSTKKLVCLNKKCNFISNAKSIIWKCKLCQKEFTSFAKIFNPLENKILQNSVFKCLLYKELCYPQKTYCSCLINRNTNYYHNKNCEGELYKGILNNKLIVVCGKCHAVNYYEKFIWKCPLCKTKFYFNGQKYKSEITKNKSIFIKNYNKNINTPKFINKEKELNSLIKKHKILYSLEKYNILSTNYINNDRININKINNKERNLSSNIRLFINDEISYIKKDKNKRDGLNNKIYNKNTYNSPKINLEDEDTSIKYQHNKKCVRYKTLHDILREKKNKIDKRNDDINNKSKYNSNNNDDSIYKYNIMNNNFDNEKPPHTTSKKINKSKNLIHNYIYNSNINVNININPKVIKNSDNIINISNISNSDEFINKNCEKNVFEKIEESDKENNIYKYKSIRRNLQKKFLLNKINQEDNENIARSSVHKGKNKKIDSIYNKLIINGKNESKNEINNVETIFYFNKNLKKNMFKHNTIDIKREENENKDKKFYSKFKRRERQQKEIYPEKNDENKVYNSSRFKQNKFYKALFLNREKDNNEIRNKISETEKNEISISPYGDIGSSIISKDDFLKISKKCTIPTFEENNITYIRPIGQGSYGVIYLVEEKNSKTQYALKSILCNDLGQILKHKKEFELSFSLNHNNFIKIYSVLFKYLDMTTYILYVLMERGDTDWNTEIEKRAKLNNYYNEYELINILKQLVNVLFYFQKNNIAHRDIKPQNILVFKNNVYKITDLGEAKDVKNNIQLATLKGSHFFMSPNLFFSFKNGNNSKVNHNIYKSDVFSLGFCFLYAMNLNLKLIQDLREENNMKNTMLIMKKFKINERYSDKFMNIIYKMIQVDENKRYDFIELYNEIKMIF